MIQFEADKKHLTFLLDLIDNRVMALPDFQRSFVWDPGATRELVVSIIRSFPAGSLLLMQGGGSIFAPREFEEAPTLEGLPAYLVLDGQQRLTSLYQAFGGKGSHRFFLNLRELLDGLEVDEAVEVHAKPRAKRWASIQAQATDLMLPLGRLRSFADWKDEVQYVLEERVDDWKKVSRQLNELEKEFVKPVEQYQFPVTTLSASTPAEAVCTIFETLNRTGVKLSVFELITARAFAHGHRLRDMWDQAGAAHPVLEDFQIDPYYVLQVIALMEKGSPKRGVVLGLKVEAIVERWDEAIRGLAGSLKLLRDECGVLAPKWLPYFTMLVPMAAAWGQVATQGPAEGAGRAKLKRWFWSCAFTGAYENNANSMAERDIQELGAWLRGEAKEPTVVRMFSFDPERWRDVTYRQRALYRASIALLMRHHPLDFHSAKALTKQSIDEEGVDDHHIFPRNYLKGVVEGDVIDSVLNHTLIDRKTNMRISDKAPSVYLAEMEKELGDELHKILRSHRLPAGHEEPLFKDRFDDFLTWRIDQLTDELVQVSGGVIDEHGVLWSSAKPSTEPGIELEESSSEAPYEEGLTENVSTFLGLRAGNSERLATATEYLRQLLQWPGVQAWVGRSNQSKDGYAYAVNVTRRGLGASFAYVYPSSMKVVFRLKHAEADGVDPVELRNVPDDARNQVRASLLSDPGFQACLVLAKRAYDKTFGKSPIAASVP